MVDPQLIEALQRVEKPTQKLLKNVIHIEPVQQMLMTFLADNSRSFEDWIWDPKTREVLGRLEAMAQTAGPQLVQSDPTLKTNYEDALLNHIDNMDIGSIVAAAETAKTAGTTHFKQKRFEAALNAFRKAVDLLKSHLESDENDEVRSLFVKCCTNAAICGLKLQMWPTVREFAQAAVARNQDDGKAWYCLAKLFVWEERYDEARDAAENALRVNPTDAQCHHVLAAVEQVQREKEARAAAEQAELQREANRLRQEEEERVAKMPPPVDRNKPRFVALPPPTRAGTPSSLLHMYFQQSKELMTIEYAQLHDPSEGEPPLFECIITNESTQTRLATSRAPNKKKAQAIASEVAILKLWFDRVHADTLHADDAAYVDAHPEIKAQLDAMDFGAVHTDLLDLNVKRATYTGAIFPRDHEAALMPAMYLNQLDAQGKLHMDFDVQDLSDIPNNIQLYRVSAVLNGRVVATDENPSKKAAKHVVAQVALETAIRESRAMFPNETEEDAWAAR
ncbi:Aste57867_13457 [Aphanomyces stellatus]|uniref:Aste57867_13457 protein n=1 Tax=Aphanomyces stellatus TaxID=120398 RepID=A0A485L089_9STRA|nr:hypothetical protein As57867_013407 [Aphanomyces stellatus]VFT90295.1 Aste57867_13457 [Aphanomyces stellatus]